ncbi:MAG: sterol carrier protein domain-containing protein, partial [Promethearchaeota archaeon]
RIVNILSLFNQLQLSFPKQDIYMEIKDKQIEQNNGVFCLSSDYPIKKIDNLLKPIDVSISISDLVPLITGRKSALDLYFMGKLRVIQTQSNSGSNQSEKIINSLDKIPPIVHEIDKIFPKQITFSWN